MQIANKDKKNILKILKIKKIPKEENKVNNKCNIRSQNSMSYTSLNSILKIRPDEFTIQDKSRYDLLSDRKCLILKKGNRKNNMIYFSCSDKDLRQEICSWSTRTSYSQGDDLKMQLIELKTKVINLAKKYKLRERIILNENEKLKKENSSIKEIIKRLLKRNI